jgi:tetratricopeptide (TPR) repeat protein
VHGAEKKGSSAEHANKAVQLSQQGATDQAIEEFSKAIEVSPKDFRLYNDRGKVLRAVNKLPEAVADFTKAIELAPKDFVAYSERGATLVVQNQVDAGMQDLNKALELKPNDPATLERRGLGYYKQKNYNASLEDLNNALTQNPKSVLGLNRRADTYAALGRWAEAKPDLELVLQLKPDDFTAQDHLMQVNAHLVQAAPRQVTEAATPPPTPTPPRKTKLLTRANIFIAMGAVLVLIILGAVIGKMMTTRRSSDY